MTERPVRENNFGIPPSEYRRTVYQCLQCKVYYNAHSLIHEKFYEGVYRKAVYQEDLNAKYQKIMQLPPEKSDNRQRVERICKFIQNLGWNKETKKVLDVGSGLCVFLGAMKECGFKTIALDPDPVAVLHAKGIGVDESYQGSIEDANIMGSYDLITFNKVLEHITDPISALERAKNHMASGGIIYVELPDGDEALKQGDRAFELREEFYIEHHAIYNRASFDYLIRESGLECVAYNSIHEPSDKYTLYGFLRKKS